MDKEISLMNSIFPLEIVEYLFYFLDGHSLLNCSATCKNWNELADNWKIWNEAVERYLATFNDKPKKYVKRVLKYERRLRRTQDGWRGFVQLKLSNERKKDAAKDPKYQFLVLANICMVTTEFESLFSDKAHETYEPQRIFSTIADAVLSCKRSGFVYVSRGNYNDERLDIDKPIHIIGHEAARINSPEIYIRPAPREEISFYNLSFSWPSEAEPATREFIVHSGVLSVYKCDMIRRNQQHHVEIMVKKGAALNMLEANIRYQDDKEKISFITVEGSASIVKSNIVSRTIAAVRVEKGADVVLEQTSISALDYAVVMMDDALLEMSDTKSDSLLINEECGAILLRQLKSEDPEKISAACVTLGDLKRIDVLQSIVDVLGAYSENILVVRGALFALNKLVYAIDSSSEIPGGKMDLLWLIKPVVDISRQYISNSFVTNNAFNILRNQLIYHKDNSTVIDAIWGIDCIDLVIESLEHHANVTKPKAFLHVVDFLTTLVIRLRKVDYDQAKNVELLKKLVESKSLNVFVAEAQKLLAEHQFKYMEAILRFMFMISSGVAVELGNLGVIGFILHVVKHEGFARQSPKLISIAFELMSRIIQTGYYDFMEKNGVDTLLQLIFDEKMFKDNEKVTSQIMEIFYWLVFQECERDKSTVRVMLLPDNRRALLSILADYFARSTDISTRVVAVLENLAREPEAKNFLNEDAVELVVNCMRLNNQNANLIGYCCGFFRSLLLNSNVDQIELNRRFTTLDLLPTIFNYFTAHTTNYSTYYEIAFIASYLASKGRWSCINEREVQCFMEGALDIKSGRKTVFPVSKVFYMMAKRESLRPSIMNHLKAMSRLRVTPNDQQVLTAIINQLTLQPIEVRKYFVHEGLLSVMDEMLTIVQQQLSKSAMEPTQSNIQNNVSNDGVIKRMSSGSINIGNLVMRPATLAEENEDKQEERVPAKTENNVPVPVPVVQKPNEELARKTSGRALSRSTSSQPASLSSSSASLNTSHKSNAVVGDDEAAVVDNRQLIQEAGDYSNYSASASLRSSANSATPSNTNEKGETVVKADLDLNFQIGTALQAVVTNLGTQHGRTRSHGEKKLRKDSASSNPAADLVKNIKRRKTESVSKSNNNNSTAENSSRQSEDNSLAESYSAGQHMASSLIGDAQDLARQTSQKVAQIVLNQLGTILRASSESVSEPSVEEASGSDRPKQRDVDTSSTLSSSGSTSTSSLRESYATQTPSTSARSLLHHSGGSLSQMGLGLANSLQESTLRPHDPRSVMSSADTDTLTHGTSQSTINTSSLGMEENNNNNTNAAINLSNATFTSQDPTRNVEIDKSITEQQATEQRTQVIEVVPLVTVNTHDTHDKHTVRDSLMGSATNSTNNSVVIFNGALLSYYAFTLYYMLDSVGRLAESDEIREQNLAELTQIYKKVNAMLHMNIMAQVTHRGPNNEPMTAITNKPMIELFAPKEQKKIEAWLPWTQNRVLSGKPFYSPKGPVILDINSATPNIKLSEDCLRVTNSSVFFESIRANRSVTQGKWYYELETATSGLFQIGWISPKAEFKAHEGYGVGVGDDDQGWAVDYQRGVVWHNNKTLYGPGKKICKSGDIIQVLLDFDNRVMRFGLNGHVFGDAFVNFEAEELFPAISLGQFQECLINFGGVPFNYPKVLEEGYKPYNKAAIVK